MKLRTNGTAQATRINESFICMQIRNSDIRIIRTRWTKDLAEQRLNELHKQGVPMAITDAQVADRSLANADTCIFKIGIKP